MRFNQTSRNKIAVFYTATHGVLEVISLNSKSIAYCNNNTNLLFRTVEREIETDRDKER